MMFLPELLRGASVTIKIFIFSFVLKFSIAFIAGLARVSNFFTIRFISGAFIELFLCSSLLVQMFFFFYALPMFGIVLSPFIAGVIALGLNGAAYAAEIVRAGILSISRDQIEAGIALNMTGWQRM